MARNEENLNNINYFGFFEEIAKSKNLEIIDVINCFKTAIEQVFLKMDPESKVEFEIDRSQNIFKFYKNKIVLNDEDYEHDFRADKKKEAFIATFIKLSDAQKIQNDIQDNDQIKVEVIFTKLPQQNERAIRSQFSQLLNTISKENIYNKYKDKIGTLVKARITSRGPKGINLLIKDDNLLAFMPLKYTHKKYLEANDTSLEIDAYVETVMPESKYSQIILSTVSNKILLNEFEKQIPEIANKEIAIINIARNASNRSKVSIAPCDNKQIDYDITGAVIGPNSSRINAICEKLGEEKIDIVRYSENKIDYIVNAFMPARILSVIEKSKDEYDVIVPNSQLTLAIGKGGVNVSLVVDLVNAKLNILKYDEAIKNNIQIIFNGNVSEAELDELNKDIKRERSTFTRIPRNKQKERHQKPKDMFESVDFDSIMNEINEFNNIVKTSDSYSEYKDELTKDIEKIPRSFSKKDNSDKDDFENDFAEFEQAMKESSSKESLMDIQKTMSNFTTDKDLLDSLGDLNIGDITDEDWD
ncbi:NusA N-terminal domain-containing protein [Mycoplasma elephantis]|uniref:NusA N-terminal domain-containing protein n=1 Tax=Mycoplasma elephantis TaxID=114882 RepID=UPI00048013C6|nr:NusA N-terminal domain-containing protein [Mycoplasma elephantis]